MGEKKVTLMLLKVDLDCSSCYKKVKKTLCKFPQIRDQVYDEKNNTVKITVLCCSPEKIRDKLCCKAGGVIKSIEILEPAKPKEPPKKPQPEKPNEATKKPQPEKPNEAPKKPQPALPAAVPVSVPAPALIPKPFSNVPAPAPGPLALEEYPMPYFNGQCPGAPCYPGYGMQVAPPQPCYDKYGNCYGYAYGQGQGGYYGYNNQQRCCLNRCDQYFSEDNPSSCAIM